MTKPRGPVNPMYVDFDIAAHTKAVETMTSPRQMAAYFAIYVATVAGKTIPLNYVQAAKLIGLNHNYYRTALKELRMVGLVEEDENLGVVLAEASTARREAINRIENKRSGNVIQMPKKP